MVKRFCFMFGALCLGVLLGGGSCSTDIKNAESALAGQINSNPSTITLGIYNGLGALAQKNATDAKLTSLALGDAAENAGATFSGSSLPLGSDAQAVLNGLGSKAPASAAGITSMITGAIQTFVTIPSASQKVPAATCVTVVNLCNEIISATNQYNATLVPPGQTLPLLAVPVIPVVTPAPAPVPATPAAPATPAPAVGQ
jgi:hypothetical protein